MSDLIEGPSFAIDIQGETLSVACGGCGGGAWLPREEVADWTGDHARMCMADILEEELPEDDDDEGTPS